MASSEPSEIIVSKSSTVLPVKLLATSSTLPSGVASANSLAATVSNVPVASSFDDFVKDLTSLVIAPPIPNPILSKGSTLVTDPPPTSPSLLRGSSSSIKAIPACSL